MSPAVSDAESRMLDDIDILATLAGPADVAAADPERAIDALTESLFVERRLSEAREQTWLRWAQDQSLFDVYPDIYRKRGER
ncbi:hypothetical protein [Gordonia iterans]